MSDDNKNIPVRGGYRDQKLGEICPIKKSGEAEKPKSKTEKKEDE